MNRLASILVVEDDDVIADVLAYRLANAGYAVTRAPDGVGAISHLRKQHVDVILLDLMLPRMSGLDVLRMARRESTTPVIIMSARDGDADQVDALELGADDYVTKPFSVRQLLARVSAVLRRSGVVNEPLPEPDDVDLVIDEARHEVQLRGGVVPLAPKEFELLLHLARHADRVCSRESLLDEIWGYGLDGQTRTVDVHVHWLRKKLERDPARPAMLVTVRQYGYRLTTTAGGRKQVLLRPARQHTEPAIGGADVPMRPR